MRLGAITCRVGPSASRAAFSLGSRRTGECTNRPPSLRRTTVMREAIGIRPRTLSGLVTAQSPSSKWSSILAHLGGEGRDPLLWLTGPRPGNGSNLARLPVDSRSLLNRDPDQQC